MVDEDSRLVPKIRLPETEVSTVAMKVRYNPIFICHRPFLLPSPNPKARMIEGVNQKAHAPLSRAVASRVCYSEYT